MNAYAPQHRRAGKKTKQWPAAQVAGRCHRMAAESIKKRLPVVSFVQAEMCFLRSCPSVKHQSMPAFLRRQHAMIMLCKNVGAIYEEICNEIEPAVQL